MADQQSGPFPPATPSPGGRTDAARRAVRQALKSGDGEALAIARAQVQAAKVGLGERGPVWWDDGAPDLNRHKARNTPYAGWAADHEA